MDAIDAKIRKLQMIRELASDKEALALMREIVAAADNPVHTPNGNGSGMTPAPKPPLTLTPPPTGRQRAVWGEQQKLTEIALRSATEPVRTDWLVKKMIENGYTFTAKTPSVAVNECLRQLERENKARLVRSEGLSNYWEAIK